MCVHVYDLCCACVILLCVLRARFCFAFCVRDFALRFALCVRVFACDVRTRFYLCCVYADFLVMCERDFASALCDFAYAARARFYL